MGDENRGGWVKVEEIGKLVVEVVSSHVNSTKSCPLRSLEVGVDQLFKCEDVVVVANVSEEGKVSRNFCIEKIEAHVRYLKMREVVAVETSVGSCERSRFIKTMRIRKY